MFDQFFGLPLHPFVVHATVVLLPASAVIALAYTTVVSWRWLLRWPLFVLSVVAPALTWVTVESGTALEEQTGLNSALIQIHQQRAETLLMATLAFGLVGVLAAYAMGGPSPLVSGAGERRGVGRALQVGVGVLLALASVLVLVWVVLTGDAGARAAWEQFAV
jgi:glucan phosphoethanolaminetransferase (alkaline phosphatase superfamily)